MTASEYTKLIETGKELFRHVNQSAAICLFGIGDIVAVVVNDTEPEDGNKGGIGNGRAKESIEKLLEDFKAADHDHSSSYYSSAYRCSQILDIEQRQVLINNCVPFRDIEKMCSRKLDKKRVNIIADIKKNGRGKYKNFARNINAESAAASERSTPIIIHVPVVAEQATDAILQMMWQLKAQGIKPSSVQVFVDMATSEFRNESR